MVEYELRKLVSVDRGFCLPEQCLSVLSTQTSIVYERYFVADVY